jgi:hypothetical protein
MTPEVGRAQATERLDYRWIYYYKGNDIFGGFEGSSCSPRDARCFKATIDGVTMIKPRWKSLKIAIDVATSGPPADDYQPYYPCPRKKRLVSEYDCANCEEEVCPRDGPLDMEGCTP